MYSSILTDNFLNIIYLAAAVLVILALRGLSHQTTAVKGNLYGMLALFIALLATILNAVTENLQLLIIAIVIGSIIGLALAKKVAMTQMPELVAILHSLVGLAAVIIGINSLFTITTLAGVEKTIHNIEVYLGVIIGSITFSGSIVAYLKLSAMVSGNPLTFPFRHFLNLLILVALVFLGVVFVSDPHSAQGTEAFIAMLALSFIFGILLVAAIGGADMPVVISMLNSYSGWAASATGFMLSNDLLIIVGALVGSSGAILSYIMCKAMNRKFLAVIAGGFGGGSTNSSSSSGEQIAIEGEITEVQVAQVSAMLVNAKTVMILPGYGLAVAQAQHLVRQLVRLLKAKGIDVKFGVHPVAGRMPGHINVLLAEAKVPYDIVFEMDEINDDFDKVDVSIVIGANDIVNPAAIEVENSPIAGMPVLQPWHGKNTIIMKRSMATGYAGVENPLFYKDNSKMLFGDAKDKLQEIINSIDC